MIKKGNSID